MTSLWRWFGIACVGVGAAGVFVPLLPTTPFLLLAAWAFARNSERWRRWLVEHPRFGPSLRAWQQQRAIPYRAKVIALGSLVLSLALTVALALPSYVLATQFAALVLVSSFILTRPTS